MEALSDRSSVIEGQSATALCLIRGSPEVN